MKKLLIAASAFMVLLAACKKDPDVVSQTVTASWPTISFAGGGQYFSINTGGSLPTVSATAYDSLLMESYPVNITGQEAVDNTTPGLYIVSAVAKNKYGYITRENVYIAVTDIPASVNMSGKYARVGGAAGVSNVTQLARGLYQLDNVGGVNRTTSAGLIFPVLFVQPNDSIMLIPQQPTPDGNIQVMDENEVLDQAVLHRSPGDTTYTYYIISGHSFKTARTFKKQ